MARIVPPIARRAKRITSGAGLDGMLARSVAKIKKICRSYICSFDVNTVVCIRLRLLSHL